MSFRGMLIGTRFSFALLQLLSRDGLGGLSPVASSRVVFLGFATAALLAAFIVWRGIPESLQRTAGRSRQAPVAPSAHAVKSDRRWLLSRQVSVVLGIVLLTASAFEIISPILIKYLYDHVSANLLLVALAFLPAALVGAVLPSRLEELSDRIGRRPPMIGALLIGCLATLAIPFAQSLWPLALLWAFEAAAFAAATPAEEALVADIAASERLGMVLGFYTLPPG